MRGSPPFLLIKTKKLTGQKVDKYYRAAGWLKNWLVASPAAVLKFLLLFLKAAVENFHTEPLFLERLPEQINIKITKKRHMVVL